MRVTDAFLGEHGVFYAQFDQLDDLASTASSTDEVARAARTLCETLVAHAKMEEELLFAALKRLGEGTEPLGSMHEEHVEIERLLEVAGRTSSLPEAVASLHGALDLAREHFQKEEEIVFPMAARLLPASELSALGASWGRTRGVRLVDD